MTRACAHVPEEIVIQINKCFFARYQRNSTKKIKPAKRKGIKCYAAPKQTQISEASSEAVSLNISDAYNIGKSNVAITEYHQLLKSLLQQQSIPKSVILS